MPKELLGLFSSAISTNVNHLDEVPDVGGYTFRPVTPAEIAMYKLFKAPIELIWEADRDPGRRVSSFSLFVILHAFSWCNAIAMCRLTAEGDALQCNATNASMHIVLVDIRIEFMKK